MNDLLDKGAKSIRIWVFEFASPAVDTGIHRVENMAETGAEDRKLTRTHVWRSLDWPGRNTSADKTDENDLPVMLPLQRYAKKQKESRKGDKKLPRNETPRTCKVWWQNTSIAAE